jgi:Heterokaryon incompatibility protein (HET)
MKRRKRISTTPLVYSPLRTEQREIRLIRLAFTEPTHHDAFGNSVPVEIQMKDLPRFGNLVPVEIKMEHFPFDQCPRYQALSYTWNSSSTSDDHTYPILVNGYAFPVSENLFFALRQLRQRKLKDWLWIDAICIDQKNDAEKSTQVQRMRSIYSAAFRVLAWLGEFQCSSRLATTAASQIIWQKWLAYIHNEATPQLKNNLTHNIHYPSRAAQGTTENRITIPLEETSFDMLFFMGTIWNERALVRDMIYEAFQVNHPTELPDWTGIFRNRFFSRIWIVQEIASAQEVVLLSGSEEIGWKDFFIVWAVLFHGVFQSVDLSPSFPKYAFNWIAEGVKKMAPLMLVSSFFRDYRKFPTMIELLRACGGFEATDPRDKVYAILGIASDSHELGLVADYSKSSLEVFTNLTEKLIQKYGLSILSLNAGLMWRERYFTKHMCEGLPSWCPDWTLPPHYTFVGERASNMQRFSAGKTTQVDTYVHFDMPLKLSLKAFIIGSVMDTRKELDSKASIVEEAQRLFTDFEELAKGLNTEIQSQIALEDASFAVPIAFPHDQSPHCSSSREAIFEAYCFLRNISPDKLSQLTERDDRIFPYLMELQRWSAGRKLFRCGEEYLGLGPWKTLERDFMSILLRQEPQPWKMQERDVVAIFLGADVPYMLRPLENGNYQLVGEAYVYGIMHGEFLLNRKEAEATVITLE